MWFLQVLLNIHNEEMVVGIALTEESLHRRNISHFGPTTLRSTLCYGMLRLALDCVALVLNHFTPILLTDSPQPRHMIQ